MFRSWFIKNRDPKPEARRSGFRPLVESLEDRWVPAGPNGPSIYQFANFAQFSGTSFGSYTVLENAGVTQLTGAVVRSGDLSATTTVQIASRDESAVAGVNYLAIPPTTITFAPNETTKNVTIQVFDDGQIVGNKTFGLELLNPSTGDVLGSPAASAVLIRDADGTQNQRYVNFLYQEVMYRQSDPGGREFWRSILDNNTLTREQVALQFLNSAEGRSVYVQNLYITLLNRPADSTGLNNFVNFLANGGTRQQLESIFQGSSEYFALYGNQNSPWLTSIYQNDLERDPDAGGESFWLTRLNQGASRQSVALSFGTSTEAYQVITTNWYADYLNRAPDPGGFSNFVNALSAGTREENLIAQFLGSAEYFAFS